MQKFNEAHEELHFDDEGRGIITSYQKLDDDFWNDVHDMQENFAFRLNGLTSVCSVPEALVNKWIREGFDFWNASAREIQQKLRAEGNTDFLATTKSF